MSRELIAGKYSKALFDIACEQKQPEEMGKDLLLVQEQLQEVPELRQFLVNAIIPAAAKKEVVTKIFGTAVSPFVLNFLKVICDRNRAAIIDDAVKGYIALYREMMNIVEAKVTVVEPLNKDDEAKLKSRLEAMTGQNVVLTYHMDPAILGGIKIQIGDRLIDGSLVRQLKQLEATLLQSEVSRTEVTNEI